MIVKDRIQRSISRSKANAFVRADFTGFGSPSQVSRALRQLVSEGRIVKIGTAAWAKAKASSLTGNPIPIQPMSDLADEVLRKIGVDPEPGYFIRRYNQGQSRQVPPGITVDTGTRRISRRISFGNQVVRYENDFRNPEITNRRLDARERSRQSDR